GSCAVRSISCSSHTFSVPSETVAGVSDTFTVCVNVDSFPHSSATTQVRIIVYEVSVSFVISCVNTGLPAVEQLSTNTSCGTGGISHPASTTGSSSPTSCGPVVSDT